MVRCQPVAKARIERVVHLVLSESEATETVRLLLESVEDPDADTPGNRVARAIIAALDLRVRTMQEERIPAVARGANRSRRPPRAEPPPQDREAGEGE